MDNGTLKEILKVKKMSFTKEEIEDIMNSELEKDPEEMDTELIDMCLDILTEEPKEKTDEEITDSSARSDKKVKKLNLKKGLLVAAIITLLLTIVIPVGAKIFDIDVPENILKVYEDFFQLDMKGEKQGEDLSTILNENDLENIILPRFLFTQCKIMNFEKRNESLTTKVVFGYIDKNQTINGKVVIDIFNNSTVFLDGEMLVNHQYERAKRIEVNEINVIVFNKESESLIVYCVEGIEYHITLSDTTFEEAIEIAKTL